ncbi:uncharacterized protein KGF55_004120 [Candida pseudojiufengensis]|uniref:uncharacterized protein n=1 Tax=Candida pseudojiufengensis TaxID=497109 RepID=UPI0022256EAC|nr:uncharacterized protein KGF55_004120 [Candida pseudojiufengensis]KAI5961195.1 hypothetical protein KGF55_004120 [Candida pseudojiufengensis]
MKVLSIIFVVAFSTMVSSKNVINLQALKDSGKIDKREAEPKNIANLQALKESLEIISEKREAKITPDLEELFKSLGDSKFKRDAKNTPALEEIYETLREISTRDAKDIPDFEEIFSKLGPSGNKNKNKRDAKNTPNLTDILNALKDESTKTKRKDTVSLSDFVTENDSKSKRDAKNKFNIEQFAKSNSKRSDEQQILDGSKGEEESKNNDLIFTFNASDSFNNLLQSILPQLKSISIFAGYIRGNSNLNSKTESLDSNMLIITPTDDAIENKLSNLKPWEFPKNIDAVTGEKEQDLILQDNLNNFLNGHIVTNFENKITIENDDEKGNGNKKVVLTTLDNGENLKIKQDLLTQRFYIKANNLKWIPVDTVKQVENGLIFVINDSLVKP